MKEKKFPMFQTDNAANTRSSNALLKNIFYAVSLGGGKSTPTKPKDVRLATAWKTYCDNRPAEMPQWCAREALNQSLQYHTVSLPGFVDMSLSTYFRGSFSTLTYD